MTAILDAPVVSVMPEAHQLMPTEATVAAVANEKLAAFQEARTGRPGSEELTLFSDDDPRNRINIQRLGDYDNVDAPLAMYEYHADNGPVPRIYTLHKIDKSGEYSLKSLSAMSPRGGKEIDRDMAIKRLVDTISNGSPVRPNLPAVRSALSKHAVSALHHIPKPRIQG